MAGRYIHEDVDVELAVKRSGTIGSLDRIEMETVEFKEKVIRGFRELSEKDGERIVVLDGSQEVEYLTDIAWEKIESLLRERDLLLKEEVSE